MVDWYSAKKKDIALNSHHHRSTVYRKIHQTSSTVEIKCGWDKNPRIQIVMHIASSATIEVN